MNYLYYTNNYNDNDNDNVDVNRLMSERENFGNGIIDNSKKRKYKVKRNNRRLKHNGDNFGEITNEIIENNMFDKGMPMRSNYQIKKEVFDQNSYLDFNLFDKTNKNNNVEYNVDYNDQVNNNLCNIDNSFDIISHKVDPHQVCMDGISFINIFLYNNINRLFNDNFNINGLSLYITFATLFFGSAKNSEIEIKKYFGFLNKDNTLETLEDFINLHVNKIFPYMSFRSYIICNKYVPVSKKFIKYSQLVPFIQIDNQDPDEVHRLNTMFENETNSPNIMSFKTLKKINISIVNILRFNPVWAIKVHAISMKKFMGSKTPFLKFKNVMIGYYEDSDKIILEVPIEGMELFYGIVLSKDHNVLIDYDNFNANLQDMKMKQIGELLIPKIVQRTKLRLNNVLKSTNLKVIFMELDLPDIFMENQSGISDVIQYCDLIIDETCTSSNSQCNNYKTMDNIIINRSFSYYLKYAPENVILSMGRVN